LQDEEPVDPLPAIKEKCKGGCTSLYKEYEACVERINAKGFGQCEPQFFDFMHCTDKCVS
ncbi:unnamed protein product, partial [Chrysoparadoxa australica]